MWVFCFFRHDALLSHVMPATIPEDCRIHDRGSDCLLHDINLIRSPLPPFRGCPLEKRIQHLDDGFALSGRKFLHLPKASPQAIVPRLPIGLLFFHSQSVGSVSVFYDITFHALHGFCECFVLLDSLPYLGGDEADGPDIR